MAKVKRNKPIKLANLFIRYAAWFIVTTLASLALSIWLYEVAAPALGIIIKVPFSQAEIDSMHRAMLEEETLTDGNFPIWSVYAVFSADGDFLYGDADPAGQQLLWAQYRQRGIFADAQGISLVRGDEVRVVKFEAEKAAFRNEWLRALFPGPGVSAAILFLVFFLTGVAILSARYGRRLAGQLHAMTQATQRIQAQDLEFSVGHSEIYEIDEVLVSIGTMKAALQTALSEQWAMEQARSEQIAALTHDIQTPLTIIRGNAELIGHSCSLAQAKAYGQYIARSAGLISAYVAMLDDLKGEGEPKEWPVSSLWQELTGTLASMCAAKRIALTADGIAPNGCVRADWPTLIRAFTNVFDNAVRYAPDGGSIRLCVEGERDRARFAIQDSGAGFSDAALHHAKERSFTEKEAPSGHGMGLYTASIALSQMGGSLSIGNDPASGGGLVEISIPIIDAH